ncbi:MAG: hypothetical protein IJ640_09705 [Prevotella sp.]|nr:hypothetical protein [Prevotella sp.]
MRSFIVFETAFAAFQEIEISKVPHTVTNGIAAIEKCASDRRIALDKDEMRRAVLTLAGILTRSVLYK